MLSQNTAGTGIIDAEYVEVIPREGEGFTSSAYKKVTHSMNKVWRNVLVAVFVLISIVMVEFMLNINELRWWNVIPLAVVSVLIVAKGFSPKIVFWVIGLGGLSGLLDGDDSTSFGDGIVRGVKLLYKTVISVLFGFWFASILLTLVPWHQRPEAFIAFMVAILFVLILFQKYDVELGSWIVPLGTVAAIIVALWSFWTTLPYTWFGQMFDTQNGRPLYMMEADGSRVFTDVLVADCAVTDVNGVKTSTKCFSPYTGKPLVAVTHEVAQKQSLLGAIQNPFSTTKTETVSKTPTTTKEVQPAEKLVAEKLKKHKKKTVVTSENSDDDIPTIRGGQIVFTKMDEQKVFYIEGTVSIINAVNCSNIRLGPAWAFHFSKADDGRHNAITPKSGRRELATVEIVPDNTHCGRKSTHHNNSHELVVEMYED